MLTPRETPTRERKSLDGLWRFALDRSAQGRTGSWWRQLLAGAREIPVPASYNDLFADAEAHDHVGDVWYQTVARIPERWRGERIVLRFDSATHRAVVWVDDTQIAEHEGGYTPFEADITEIVEPGSEIRVTAVVDNTLSWQSIPPGYVEETPDGRRQRYFHDFFNYAGLHRSVWLYTTPASYVADVTVVTGLDGSTGTVGYEVETAGEGGADVRATLRDAGGSEVARATGASGELTVEDAHLWRPGDGYLYELTVELWRDGDAPIDVYPLPVGIRTVRVEGTRFLINGEPFYFKGFGKHEDAAVRGKGHDDAFMIHDFALMDWLGANSFRTSHYPYAEEVLDYADRHGIVVTGETAAVGLNASLGGVLGGVTFTTFSDETINAATQEVHRQAIRELIARDKNHPSVVIWSIANEPESWTPESRAYFEPLVGETRRLDPTRPVAFANFMAATPDRDVISDLFD
nr:beta-glucuronidase [Actinomycetota bacterium]